jgi:hypothetical protein
MVDIGGILSERSHERFHGTVEPKPGTLPVVTRGTEEQ